MNTRDEFSTTIKRVLAARAGHRCSNPDCGVPTSAPHAAANQAINIGVAAHISAAAEGGPRFDAGLTAEERAGIHNAIWLCQNCAKLIDNDPQHFTVDLLNRWKRAAEARALSALGKPPSPELLRALQSARRSIEGNISTTAKELEDLQREQLDLLHALSERIEKLAAAPPADRRRSVSDLIRELEGFRSDPIVGPANLFTEAISLAPHPRLILDTVELVEYGMPFYRMGAPFERLARFARFEQLARTYMLACPGTHVFIILPTVMSELVRVTRAVYLASEHHLSPPGVRLPGQTLAQRIQRLRIHGRIVDSETAGLAFDPDSIMRSELFARARGVLERGHPMRPMNNFADALNLAFVHDANIKAPKSHLLISSSARLRHASRQLAKDFGGDPCVVESTVPAGYCFLTGQTGERLETLATAARESREISSFIERLVGVLKSPGAEQLLGVAAGIRAVRNSLGRLGSVLTDFSRSLGDVALQDWNIPLREFDIDEVASYAAAREQVEASFDALLTWIAPLEQAMEPFLEQARS
jgi:hypothetical protein